jgi:astacin (peptidase family M12A)/VCBS repeat protein/uncharacterized protein DUF5648/FG-GAP repeat protein
MGLLVMAVGPAACGSAPQSGPGLTLASPSGSTVTDRFDLRNGDILVPKTPRGPGGRIRPTAQVTTLGGRWGPNCRLPFAIDPGIPNPNRILQAIAQLESRTHCRFPAVVDPSNEDYIYFERNNQTLACSSAIGRVGGKQWVEVNDKCGPNRLIHEIGHAIGFDHEQNRADREGFVTFHPENVLPDSLYQNAFDVDTSGFTNLGSYYDYSSIMHYDDDKWARAAGLKTLVRKDGYAIPRHYVLSAGDLNAITKLYPVTTAPVTIKVGDFDGDGKADIAQSGGTWSGIPLARAIATGAVIDTNTTPAFGAFPVWAQSTGVRILSGDFDGDGKTDIALTGGLGWSTLPIARSDGDGTFTVTNTVVGDFAGWATAPGVQVLTGDFNSDGCTDVALTGPSGWSTLPLALSNCRGGFTVQNVPAAQFAAWAAMPGTTVRVLHHKRGGDRIALVGVPGLASLPVGQFSFGSSWAFHVVPYLVGDFAIWARSPNVRILSGDFDGDGYGDLALSGVTGWTTAPIAVLPLSTNIAPISNPQVGLLAVLAPNPVARVVVADFDGDGRDDLAVVVPGETKLVVAFSRGASSLHYDVAYDRSVSSFLGNAAKEGAQLLVGDFNGDKKADLALVGSPSFSQLPLLLSGGGGSFVASSVTTDATLWAAQPGAITVGTETDDRQYPVAAPSAGYLHSIESPRNGVHRLLGPDGEHFYTTSTDEAMNLVRGGGWTVENWNYYYLRASAEIWTDTNYVNEYVPFYRCRLRAGKHLDTQSSSCEGAGSAEGILGYIATGPIVNPLDPTATDVAIPLFRLYKPSNGDHFFTTDWSESLSAQANGYVFVMVTGFVWRKPGS